MTSRRCNKGEFVMGSDGPAKDEQPRHTVYLDDHWIYKYEVTVGQYRMFAASTGKRMPKEPAWGWIDSMPMVNVGSAVAEPLTKKGPRWSRWTAAGFLLACEWVQSSGNHNPFDGAQDEDGTVP